MKLFQNFFAPKWKNKNPDIRKQALIGLNRDDNQSVFLEIANQDDTPELRQLAVKRINDLAQLFSISVNNSDIEVRKLAKRIISQILAGLNENSNELSIAEIDRIEQMSRLDDQSPEDQKILEFIAQNGDTTQIRRAAIDKVSRESLLGDIVIKDKDAQTRKHVAEKLTHKSTLERVLKATKNKDKQISKLLKNKLEQLIAIEEHPKLILAKQKSLCAAMEQLGKKGLWERDKIQSDQIKEQWATLAIDNMLELTAKFDSASQHFQNNYDQYLARNEARLKQEAKLLPIKEKKQTQLEQLHQLLLQASDTQNVDSSQQLVLSTELAKAEANWRSIETLPNEIEIDFSKQYTDVIKAIKTKLKELESTTKTDNILQSLHRDITQLLKQSHKLTDSKISSISKKLESVTNNETTQENIKSEIIASIKKAENILEKNTSKAKQIFTTTEKLLTTLDRTLKDGEIKSANETQKKIQSNIKQLDKLGHVNLTSLKTHASEVSTKLQELNKWRSWANTPQKERLISEIETLISSDLDPKEIAFLVSKARKDWQKLGPSDQYNSQALWERFNTACDTAYEPCKAVFDEEAKTRNENYKKRISFVDNLETFINNANWEEVNWVKVENLYQQARSEWQNLGPIDKNKRNEINSRFNKAHMILKQKLSTEWAKNEKTKQAIIDTSHSLLEQENLEEAINTAKHLQKQWKNAGRVQRQVENKLWTNFRGNCDKIFAKRDSIKQQKQIDEKETASHKETICTELESLCNKPAKEINQYKDKIFELKNQLLDLPSAEGKSDKALKDRVNQALHIMEMKKQVASRIEQIASLANLKTKVDLLHQLELSIEKQEPIVWEEVEPQLSGFENTPNENWKEIIDARLKALKDTPDASQILKHSNENKEDLENTIILLEIIAEIDTPEGSSAKRLKIQTERLSNKLNNHAEESQWDAFLNYEQNWLLCGPVPASDLDYLKDRHTMVISELKQQYTEELEEY